MEGLSCPSCETALSEAAKVSGPDAPEVGWEYYECPGCGEKSHPGIVEDTDPAAASSSTRRFMGTVVDTSDPVVLDDGDTVVECQDLSSEVKLGKQVTVVGTEQTGISPEHDQTDVTLTGCTVVEPEQ